MTQCESGALILGTVFVAGDGTSRAAAFTWRIMAPRSEACHSVLLGKLPHPWLAHTCTTLGLRLVAFVQTTGQ